MITEPSPGQSRRRTDPMIVKMITEPSPGQNFRRRKAGISEKWHWRSSQRVCPSASETYFTTTFLVVPLFIWMTVIPLCEFFMTLPSKE